MALIPREHGDSLASRSARSGGGYASTRALAVVRRHGRLAAVVFLVVFAGAATVARVTNALAAFYVEENGKILVRQASAARLTRLQQELVRMQEVYTARYPDVIRLKAEIAGLERSPKASAAIGEEFRILDPA